MRFSRSSSMAVIMLLLMGSMMVQQNEACRLLSEEAWARQGLLLLQALQKGPVRPPGNGCSYTGGGGAPCTATRILLPAAPWGWLLRMRPQTACLGLAWRLI
ncbi:hypothetical protein NL676_002781 [Syzygium grande]|nr:hypothetical protein NL676_002781 [Syzygium grande]